MNGTSWMIFALVSLAATTLVLSALPPRSKEDLEKSATDIVVGEVKQVFAHPQALAQCSGWLDRNLPHAQAVDVASNAIGAERALDTSVQMLRTVPFLAMAPLLIIWLGLDEAPKLTLVGLAAFFPVYINTFAGIRNVDRKLIEVGQVYQLSRAEMLTRVIIPAALPAVFTGVRYGLGVAWLALAIFCSACSAASTLVLLRTAMSSNKR